MDYEKQPMAKAHETFKIRQQEPWNAEPPLGLLIRDYYTPEEVLFGRNHGPMREGSSQIKFRTLQNEVRTTSLQEFEALGLPRIEVTAALQCAGNRRKEMGTAIREVEGVEWENGVIGNCRWSGYKMLDVLRENIHNLARSKGHVEFISYQACEEDSYYGASCPLDWFTAHPDYPAILATHMNGEPLSPAHGGPMRIVLPGVTSARWVKWVDEIRLSSSESDNFYMQKDYKVLPSSVRDKAQKEEAMRKVEPCYSMDLSSVICEPSPDSPCRLVSEEYIIVKGYAVNGRSGSPIHSVDLTVRRRSRPTSSALDNNVTATSSGPIQCDSSDVLEHYNATLRQDRHTKSTTWAWCLWECQIPSSDAEILDIASQATDEAGHRQVELREWNIRGIMNTSISKVENVRPEKP